MVTEIPLWILKEKNGGDVFEDGAELEIEKFTLIEGYDGETFISLKVPYNNQAL